jgi:hypothetical protein
VQWEDKGGGVISLPPTLSSPIQWCAELVLNLSLGLYFLIGGMLHLSPCRILGRVGIL